MPSIKLLMPWIILSHRMLFRQTVVLPRTLLSLKQPKALKLDNPEKDNPDKDNPDKDNPDKDNPDKGNPGKGNPGKGNQGKGNLR